MTPGRVRSRLDYHGQDREDDGRKRGQGLESKGLGGRGIV